MIQEDNFAKIIFVLNQGDTMSLQAVQTIWNSCLEVKWFPISWIGKSLDDSLSLAKALKDSDKEINLQLQIKSPRHWTWEECDSDEVHVFEFRENYAGSFYVISVFLKVIDKTLNPYLFIHANDTKIEIALYKVYEDASVSGVMLMLTCRSLASSKTSRN